MTYKVFVTRELPKSALKLLYDRFDVEIWSKEVPPPKNILLTKVKELDGLLPLLTESIDREVLRAGNQLQIVSQMAVGYDNIDVTEATQRGIYVTNTPGVLTETTADYAFALLMATARRIAEADTWVRQGNWKIPWGPMMFVGGTFMEKRWDLLA